MPRRTSGFVGELDGGICEAVVPRLAQSGGPSKPGCLAILASGTRQAVSDLVLANKGLEGPHWTCDRRKGSVGAVMSLRAQARVGVRAVGVGACDRAIAKVAAMTGPRGLRESCTPAILAWCARCAL
eukprot:884836-Amorphochlora_amoeboformis.AAC.1